MVDGGWNGYSVDRLDDNLSYCQIFQLLCLGCNKRVKPRATPKDIPIDERRNLFNITLNGMIINTITRGGWMKNEKVSSQPLQKVVI